MCLDTINNLDKAGVGLRTPFYLIDEKKIVENLKILKAISLASEAKIILAQKAFSAYALYPTIAKYLYGSTASSLHEASLANKYMPNSELHIFSPAYREDEIDEIIEISDYMVFNSFSQYSRYKDKISAYNLAKTEKKVSAGLRLNPEFSTQSTPLYDPCAPFSRFGITSDKFEVMDEATLKQQLVGIEGFHMHSLCEQNFSDLLLSYRALEQKFSKYFKYIKWLNLGGGHHITRNDYDRVALVELLKEIKEKYNLQVYLEPGEAIAYHAGYLVSSVLDFVENGKKIAILDTSAECHMPDVLAMPYRPEILAASTVDKYTYKYLLSSATCLAGDVIGEYSFAEDLVIGQRLYFTDMAIYSMVKNNTFNGINLPSIALLKEDGSIKLWKSFGFEDFEARL